VFSIARSFKIFCRETTSQNKNLRLSRTLRLSTVRALFCCETFLSRMGSQESRSLPWDRRTMRCHSSSSIISANRGAIELLMKRFWCNCVTCVKLRSRDNLLSSHVFWIYSKPILFWQSSCPLVVIANRLAKQEKGRRGRFVTFVFTVPSCLERSY
jgi:hypothetical protein